MQSEVQHEVKTWGATCTRGECAPIVCKDESESESECSPSHPRWEKWADVIWNGTICVTGSVLFRGQAVTLNNVQSPAPALLRGLVAHRHNQARVLWETVTLYGWHSSSSTTAIDYVNIQAQSSESHLWDWAQLLSASLTIWSPSVLGWLLSTLALQRVHFTIWDPSLFPV